MPTALGCFDLARVRPGYLAGNGFAFCLKTRRYFPRFWTGNTNRSAAADIVDLPGIDFHPIRFPLVLVPQSVHRVRADADYALVGRRVRDLDLRPDRR